LIALVGHPIFRAAAEDPLHRENRHRRTGRETRHHNITGDMVFKRIQEDIDAFLARDPAARSRLEVVLCYPGLHALLVYRLAHKVWGWRWTLAARFMAHVGRALTGVEIHPGARIGRRVVIDHGQGVVIGETSEIGDDVTLYQGVTLGGLAPSVNSASQKSVKRHPTLENGVIVGSGAQILGPVVIGEGARVGANAVVTRDVAPGATAVGIPAHAVMPKDRRTTGQFVPYGTPVEGCPDPVLASIDALRAQVTALVVRLDDLDDRLNRLLTASDGDEAASDEESAVVSATGGPGRTVGSGRFRQRGERS
jgi:serine O-acetyltransferase